MNTNYIAIELDECNTFRINMRFELFGKGLRIPHACFDTGCNTTLISLDETITNIKQTELLYDPSIKVTLSFGVEGKQNKNNIELQNMIKTINSVKNQYPDKNIIQEKLNNIKDKALNNIHLRYIVNAQNILLNNMQIPDTEVLVAFNLFDSFLIGMNIIKQLRTQIYSIEKGTYLISTLNSNNADQIIEENLYIDLLEQTQNITTDNSAVRANYIHKEIEKYMI